jgi:hypothetical protein
MRVGKWIAAALAALCVETVLSWAVACLIETVEWPDVAVALWRRAKDEIVILLGRVWFGNIAFYVLAYATIVPLTRKLGGIRILLAHALATLCWVVIASILSPALREVLLEPIRTPLHGALTLTTGLGVLGAGALLGGVPGYVRWVSGLSR